MSEFGREFSNFQEALPTVRAGRALRRKALGYGGRFDCGVRVVSGTVPGERSRWKHRASRLAGDVLTHGDIALRVELLDQVPHPGGFRLSARCLVWRARLLETGAVVELAFMPREAERILGSELSNGRELRPDPDIDAL
jgi:hypothetical protein